MSFRSMKIASAAIVAGLTAAGVDVAARLPTGMQLPIHWNALGEANGFAQAWIALLIPAATAAFVSLTIPTLAAIDPLQPGLTRSAPLVRTVWAGMLALMVGLFIVIAAPVLGLRLPTALPLAGVGLLLIAIGDQLPKSRPGWFVGIRTPWAMMDEDNWIVTHRLGGRTMMLGGLGFVMAALLPLVADTRTALIVASTLVAIVPPIILSWAHWHRAHRRG